MQWFCRFFRLTGFFAATERRKRSRPALRGFSFSECGRACNRRSRANLAKHGPRRFRIGRTSTNADTDAAEPLIAHHKGCERFLFSTVPESRSCRPLRHQAGLSPPSGFRPGLGTALGNRNGGRGRSVRPLVNAPLSLFPHSFSNSQAG